MTRLLLDANIWNYICKAEALDGFLRCQSSLLVTLNDVIEELCRTELENRKKLQPAIDAAQRGFLEAIDLTSDEMKIQYALLIDHPGLRSVDCGLLAVALSRSWSLVTCDKKLRNTADRLNVQLVNLDHLLDEAVDAGFLSVEKKVLVMQMVHH